MAIRIFNCARCEETTKICSCCDRGNWYCKRCAPIAERERIARAKYRYRHTFDGRSAAARRQARVRRRRKEEKEKKEEGEGQLAAREAEAVDSTTDAVPGAGDLSETSDTKPGTQDAPSCEKEALPLKESATEEAVAGTELELEEVDAEPDLQHGVATALEPEIVTDRGRRFQSVSAIIPSWSGPGRPARGEDEAAPTTTDRTKEDRDAGEPSAGRSAADKRHGAPEGKRSTLVGGFSQRQAPSWHCCDFCGARWFGVPRVALIHRRLGRGPSPPCTD